MFSFKLASAVAFVAAFFLVAKAQDESIAPNGDCPITQVCFVIDQSGSISSTEYEQEQLFVNEIAELIMDVTQNVQLSAVAFSSSAQEIQAPTSDLDAFMNSVNAPRLFPGGSTAMSLGLTECFTPLQGLPGNRIIVLVTDGVPDNEAATTAVADQIRAEEDVFLVTVGIGLTVSGEEFLQDIAEAPEFAIISEFDDLPGVVTEVVSKICEVVDTPPSPMPPSPMPPSPMPPSPMPPTPMPVEDCEEAFEECLFQFNGETGLTKYDILPNQPDKAFTPFVVPKDPTKRVGALNTNGIVPEFIDANGATPITSFGSPSFTPTHFKPFWINADSASGIGHQTFHGNQATVAKNRCVRVYFTSFQVLENVNGNFVVVDNRNNVARSENKCVVFET